MNLGRWFRVVATAAVAVALMGTQTGTTDAVTPPPTVPLLTVLDDGYLHCETCESGTGYWDGGQRCFIQFPNPVTDCTEQTEHRFNGFQCGGGKGGGDLAVSQASVSGGRTPTRLVRAGDGGGDGGGWCARCGGTSECHQEAQLGACHIECGGLAATNRALQSLERAINTADATAAQRVFADSPLINWNRERKVLQLRMDCDPSLVQETIPLDVISAARLEKLLTQ